MTRRRILWTGGFDSTWLVIDALLAGERVQALTWRGWGLDYQKAANEDAARARILSALPGELASCLEAVEAHEPRGVTWNEPLLDELDAAGDGRGGQNMLLSSLPRYLGVGLETGHVAEDRTVRVTEIRAIVEREGLALPIADRTKPELLADAERRGFRDLLTATWSCEGDGSFERPIRTACGECDPCRARIVPQVGHGQDGA